MENITRNIAHLRKLKSVSQEHMADDLGITRSKLGSYEEGRANPPIPILIKLSDYFNLPIDILLKNDLTKSFTFMPGNYPQIFKLNFEFRN